MKRIEILRRIDIALNKQNPLLVESYLRPGLSLKTIEKLTRKVAGLIEPVVELYSWHDGTKFVQLSAGETYLSGVKKVEFFPGNSFHFVDLKLAVLNLEALVEIAKHHPELREAVGRYLPFFYNGATAQFMLDLDQSARSRVMFYDSQNGKPVQQAYETLDDYLLDILHSNETGESLRFFKRYDPA